MYVSILEVGLDILLAEPTHSRHRNSAYYNLDRKEES